MAIHVGFKDLTAARRNSLMRILQEVEATACLIAGLKDMKSPTKGIVESVDRLAVLVKMQFPECRFDDQGDFEPMTNNELRASLRQIQIDIAYAHSLYDPMDIKCMVADALA